MRKSIILFSITALVAVFVYSACRRDVPVIDLKSSNYPAAIGNIMLTQCAVSGCHDGQSKDAAAGLDLSSWDKLFEGDRNGAVCVPYSADFSTLFMFTNTFSDMGVSAKPTMPNGSHPLSREQMTTLRDWINAGAPDANGFVKWSDNPNRQKFYSCQQGCDLVCVIDAETNLIMRYVPVGATPAIESPHWMESDEDNLYWYVSFVNGRYLEKHRRSDNAYLGRILLGPNDSAATGSWNSFAISPDGRNAWVIDWNPNGRIAWIDLENMVWRQTYQGSGLFIQPHGCELSENGQYLYVAPTTGNYIYKIDLTIPQLPQIDHIIVDGSGFETNSAADNPHAIAFSPDDSKYFVTCQRSNVVRVMDATTDQLITTIPVGVYPQEMALSRDAGYPYIYVSCMEDTLTYPGNRGSVSVINYQTNSFVTSINTGWQPHGISANHEKPQMFVTMRNVTTGGPAPHHSTSCGGRNGYSVLVDMTTNTVIPGSKREMAADPYDGICH